MDISALQTSGVTSSSSKKSEQQLMTENFLELMVAQFKNQDPTNPTDSNEMMGQIAQFTTATGISELNSGFKQFQQDMAGQQALTAASLVGREVLVESDKGHLPADGSLTGKIKLPVDVGNLTLSVYTESGELVRKIELGQQQQGEVDFAWDGMNDDGRAQSSGRYLVSATTELDGEVYSLATLSTARVDSVALRNGQSPLLSLEGIGELSLANVQQIR